MPVLAEFACPSCTNPVFEADPKRDWMCSRCGLTHFARGDLPPSMAGLREPMLAPAAVKVPRALRAKEPVSRRNPGQPSRRVAEPENPGQRVFRYYFAFRRFVAYMVLGLVVVVVVLASIVGRTVLPVLVGAAFIGLVLGLGWARAKVTAWIHGRANPDT